MKLSARNVISGTVTEIKSGQVFVSVKISVGGGPFITATITAEAAEDLDLKPGDVVNAVIKSTDVMIAK
ncbi:MAG: hypothetical protein GC191_04610 [Azospirillum sp.]|nr:hypothetical protein [Azospirillum sp.]